MVNMLDFILKTDMYKKFQVDDLLFVEFRCPYDDAATGIWWHTNFFAYIFSGESVVKTPNDTVSLKPGDCIFARKGCVLSINQTQKDFCELIVFVPDDFIKSVIHKHKISFAIGAHGTRPSTVIPLMNDDVLLAYFQSLLSYFSLSDPPPAVLLKLKFEELIVHLVSSHQHDSLKCYFNELCTKVKPSITDVMEANFFSNLSLNEFARLCARSLSAFKREFINIYNTSPGKWLLEKRLEYSKYLLETTDMTIDEICVASGFENQSHFIRVFKNKYGLTPGRLSIQHKMPAR